MDDMLPETLSISIFDKNTKAPIPGIAVSITLFAKEKNNYMLFPEPSDENGRICLTKQWLQHEIYIKRSTFLMDYASYKDEILIETLTREQVINVVKYMYDWKDYINTDESSIQRFEKSNNHLYKPDKSTVIKQIAGKYIEYDLYLEKLEVIQ